MTSSILTIEDIQLGVDSCPCCESHLVESTLQLKRKKKVPISQLSREQLFRLDGQRGSRRDIEIEEVIGEIPTLICNSDPCAWFIPAESRDYVLPPQPGIPVLPECDSGHRLSWRILRKLSHRLDLQCAGLGPSGSACPVKRSLWLAPPGGFLAGNPSLTVNETKARVLAALYRSPSGLTVADVVSITGLNIQQASAALDRYCNASTPSVQRGGPIPIPPNGREAYYYLITDQGERWIAWAVGVGLVEHDGPDAQT